MATRTAMVRPDIERRIARELSVARQLADSAPGLAVQPCSELPPGPHRRAGYWLSFWERVAHRADESPTPATVATALAALHAALSSRRLDGAAAVAAYPGVDQLDLQPWLRLRELHIQVWTALTGVPVARPTGLRPSE